MIEVTNLSKEFRIYKKVSQPDHKLRSLFKREVQIRRAVDQINFRIGKGEIVGYVGPNGAGKSTTIKMLCGILTPSEGTVCVNGLIPYEQRRKNALQIGAVFGQRSQLYWDLPIMDTFRLHKRMYEIPDATFKKNVAVFSEILEMEKFLDQPVRQLSLGQKMRANIALSLLHNPSIVYLDEPTIGLDVVAKSRIRDFILDINQRMHTTFILTTHDMDDIERVCNHLLLMHHGRIGYDGSLTDFKERFSGHYVIQAALQKPTNIVHPKLQVQKLSDGRYMLIGNPKELAIGEAIRFLSEHYALRDIQIRENNIESILKELFR